MKNWDFYRNKDMIIADSTTLVCIDWIIVTFSDTDAENEFY